MKLGLYWTLGDFAPNASEALAKRLIEQGISLLELGLPFSDPLLDGPVIAATHHRVVDSGYSFQDAAGDLKAIARLAKSARPPVFVSVMATSQLLYDKERRDELAVADGILVTDISSRRESPFQLPSPRVYFVSQDVVLDPSFTSLPQESISQIYLTRLQGVTGDGQSASIHTREAVTKLRQLSSAPIWIGFGISSRDDLEECARAGADGGIIGSAFVRAMDQALQKIPSETRTIALLEAATKWCQAMLP